MLRIIHQAPLHSAFGTRTRTAPVNASSTRYRTVLYGTCTVLATVQYSYSTRSRILYIATTGYPYRTAYALPIILVCPSLLLLMLMPSFPTSNPYLYCTSTSTVAFVVSSFHSTVALLVQYRYSAVLYCRPLLFRSCPFDFTRTCTVRYCNASNYLYSWFKVHKSIPWRLHLAMLMHTYSICCLYVDDMEHLHIRCTVRI